MAGALSLSVEFRGLERAASGLRTAAAATISAATLVAAGNAILLAALRAEAPVKTGAGRDSIVSRASGLQGRGYYARGYMKMQNDGTRAHTIVPRTRRALHWGGDPGVFARSVKHPGTRPNPFVRRAVDKAEPALRTLLLENGRRLVRLVAEAAA